MEGRSEALRKARDLPEPTRFRTRGDDGKESVVGTHEPALVRLHHHRAPVAPHTWIDDAHKNMFSGQIGGQGREQVRARPDVERRRLVQQVNDPNSRRAAVEDGFYLPDVEIACSEVGEEDDSHADILSVPS